MDVPKLAEQQWLLLLFTLLCLSVLVQLFYYLFFYLRIALHKTHSKTSSQTHAVSVVVCARDEAHNLSVNLPGILVQHYPTTHEVIVVNDNSFDDSRYVLDALKKEFKQLQVVELTQEAKMIPGKKFPLSIGIKTAKHETLLLTDADCVPASEFWISSMQEAYNEKIEIVLGYGAFHKQKGLLNKLVRWEGFLTALQYMSYALAGLPYMGVGRNLSYKKSVFFRHKGFSAHNHLPGGDDDLFINAAASKTNTAVNLNPQSFTLSRPAASWAEWRRQKTRHYSTSKYYKPIHKFLLALYAFACFMFYPLLAACLILVSWQWSLILLGAKLLSQYAVFIPAMKKLNEKDLAPYIFLFDLWMFVYYILFAPSLIRKPKQHWK